MVLPPPVNFALKYLQMRLKFINSIQRNANLSKKGFMRGRYIA